MSNLNCCPECFSTEIIIEEFILVCSNCGNVLNDVPNSLDQQCNSSSNNNKGNSNINLQVDCQENKGQVIHEHVNKYCFNKSKNKNTVSVTFSINLIYRISKNLNIPKRIREIAINLFKEVVAYKEFKHRTMNGKQCLALCCIYMISNQENHPITLKELMNNANFLFVHIGTFLSSLQKIRPDIFQREPRFTESLVPLYLFKHDFNDKEINLISEYATDLVWMWREALLIQAFNPIYVIYSALFYSWKAVDQGRVNTSLEQFCDKFKIDLKQTLKKRIRYFDSVLLDFFKCSPLFNEDEEISRKTISLQIKKIISMKRIILLNYQQAQNIKSESKRLLELENETDDNDEKNKTEYEQEFSDSEIDPYIRTEDEVKILEKIKT